MNNAEIADRLDGMKCGGVEINKSVTPFDVKLKVSAICNDEARIFFLAHDLLAFCRAVVERVDGYPEDYKHGERGCD